MIKVFKNGQPVPVEELPLDVLSFISKIIGDNPVAEEKQENLQCTGNPSTCELCNYDEPVKEVSFEEILKELKQNKKVNRTSWRGRYDIDYLVLTPRTLLTDPFFAIVSENGKFTPYTFDAEDILATDWILVGDDD